jgi:hypothetical protein
MSLHLPHNVYRGVNAHLHSFFQHKGGWSGFHTLYLGDLTRHISRQLPDGYRVELEQSLQIREFHPDTGERLRHPKPDVMIYRFGTAPRSDYPAAAPTAALVQPVASTLDVDTEGYYTAAVIYQALPDEAFGRPITQLELLSPGNKVGEGRKQYVEKRFATLKAGICLVEIDYLHETSSPIKGVPVYPQPDSYAYTLTISNPRPSFEEGKSITYGFGVDEPIPALELPLLGRDVVRVDFGSVYQGTFASVPNYGERADYAALPEGFSAYSAADQERIRAVMARAAQLANSP